MSLGLAAKVTAAGISAPPFSTILATLYTQVRGIYGNDIYLAPDSKDGQLLGLFAQAIADANDTAIFVYNQFSPSTAIGAGLSSIIKTNGLARLAASYSSAPGLVVGQVGVTITNGTVKDANGNLWNLPVSVTIPPAGQISVTVVAQEIGAISAPSGTINQIATPSFGWQSFASTSDASVGAPVENDVALRSRQAASTSESSNGPIEAIQGALENLSGVIKTRVYDNDTDSADSNGIPGHTICAVISGGDVTAIAAIIGGKKAPGANTYGTTSHSYIAPTSGINYTINWYALANKNVKIRVTGTALTGYLSSQVPSIQQSMVDYIALHDIGQTVEWSGLWAPAYQNIPALQQNYKVTNVEVSTDGGATWVTTDVTVPFNKIAQTATTDVTVNIT